jgi:Outer membrane protein beta-barrel domain
MRTRYIYSLIPKSIILLIFCSGAITAWPQETTTCAENLRNAQSLFDNGQVEQIPVVLGECLKSGFKQEEELAAYKLIIQTYLFQDRNEEADSAMLAFLKKYPEYQLSPTDHSSFVHLYNNFNVEPVVQLAIHLGSNLPFLTFIDTHSLSGEPYPAKYTTDMVNLFGSLELKFALNSNLEINIEGGYSQLSFTKKENFQDYATVNYSEIQHRLEIPVTATYNFITFGKFTVYARAGAGTAFDLSSTAKNVSFVRNYVIPFSDQKSPDISRNDSRIRMDIFGQAGGGIKLKIPKGYLNFEIRSNLGIYDQVLRGGDSATQLEGYKYKDDDFNLNTVNFSFGYTHIFYKPSKKSDIK